MRPDISQLITIHYHPDVHTWGTSATFVPRKGPERRHRKITLASAIRLAQAVRDTTYNETGHVFAYHDGWAWDLRPLP